MHIKFFPSKQKEVEVNLSLEQQEILTQFEQAKRLEERVKLFAKFADLQMAA